MIHKLPGYWEHLLPVIWGMLLFLVPVTSSPLVTKLIGRNMVSPLSGLPLLLLVLFWFIPYVLRGGGLSMLSKPLLFFFSVALLSSLFAPFMDVVSFYDQSIYLRGLRALLTLAIGLAFYFVVAHFPRTDGDLRRALRWLNMGAFVMLFWASVQAFYLIPDRQLPEWFRQIHSLISIRPPHPHRLVGLAYEPSWFANQLVILYIPLWISSVLQGFSAFSARGRRFSIELLLLLWGCFALFFSLSRVGLLSVFALMAALALGGASQVIDRIAKRVVSRAGKGDETAEAARRRLKALLWMALLIGVPLLMLMVVYLASQFDRRLAYIFDTDFTAIFFNAPDPFLYLAWKLRYAERVIYWLGGLRTFETHPLLGVGLGNEGFFFRQAVPALGYRLPEIIDVVTGLSFFPNVKNLWLRLLAETGALGFLTFVVWLGMTGLSARLLHKIGKGEIRVIGLAGSLTVVAQVVEGFSLDTFALPQLWIMLGLVTASLTILYRKRNQGKRPA